MLPCKPIEDFVDRITTARRRFYRAMRQGIGPYGTLNLSLAEDIPNNAAIETLIRNAFYASLETDEGRETLIRMQWVHPALGPAKLVDFDPYLPVNSPRVLTRLSQIVPNGCSLRVVLENEEFAIAGLCFTFAQYIVARRKFRDTAPVIAVTIRGVADIEYQEGGWFLAYNKGNVVTPKVIWSRHPVRRFLQGLERRVVSADSEKQIQEDVLGAQFSGLEVLVGLLGELLTSVRALRHGGTIAILPDGQFEGLTIRYPSSSNELIASSARYAEVLLKQVLARKKLQSLTEIAEEDRNQLLVSSMYPPEGRASLISTYRAVASLTSADGAVVFNRDLSLRGFGAIVDLRLEEDVKSILRNASGKIVAEDEVLGLTGTRHLAALRLAQRVPGSIVFVFSQDGEVRAFCHEDETVWCYESFRW